MCFIISGIFCHQHLIDQRTHTHHKEFIQIALIDRCKCQTLTQRHLRVLRFFQYTFIKFQPGQFPVHINCLVHCLSLYFLLPFIQLPHLQKYNIKFSLILYLRSVKFMLKTHFIALYFSFSSYRSVLRADNNGSCSRIASTRSRSISVI